MSNLNQTQAVWTQVFRELGLYCGAVKDLRDLERKFDSERNRTQVVEVNNVNASTSAWSLSGAILGTNCDELGTLWVRIAKDTPSGGQATVSVYKAAGASGLVAQGVGAYPGSITLTAQNSSGLSGSVTLATISASESTDAHQLLVFPDWTLRAQAIFNLSAVEHGALRVAFGAACDEAKTAIEDAISSIETALDGWLTGRLANFLGSSASSPLLASTNVSSGLVTTLFQGTLEDTRADMVDETNAGAQTVLHNSVSAASPSADSHNLGQGSLSTPTMNEWARSGTITLQCVDATIGSEQFSVSQRISITNETVTAKNNLQTKRQYADPTLGVSAWLLLRTLTITGASNDFNTAGNWSFSGEASGNTNAGVIYLKVISSSTSWQILGYTSSSYASSTQCFQTDVGAAGATVNINAVNGSGLSGTGKIGAAPTNNNTGSINLNCFVTQNSAGPGVADKFTCVVTRSSSGEFQDRLAELFAYAVNSATSSPSINEGMVSGGTFVPYSVRDA